MTLILSGTNGVSDIDGSAATPAIRGTDANTGIFFPAADTVGFATGGAESMRLDSSGRLGIGTTSPVNKLEVASGGLYVSGDGTFSSTGYGFNAYNADNTKTILLAYNRTTSAFMDVVLAAKNSIFENNGTERMRIDSSGNLLVGTTSVFSSGKQCIAFTGSTVQGLNIRNNADNPADTFVGFYNAYGTKVGSITAGGSTTTYNTSSDYRLKENVQPLVNALDKVMALKPVSYTWKSGGEDNGFIAHELQLILPKAVSGEKDAVNEDDTINPQGVDYSKIVATLTAAMQEQQALIQSLTDRITALETP